MEYPPGLVNIMVARDCRQRDEVGLLSSRKLKGLDGSPVREGIRGSSARRGDSAPFGKPAADNHLAVNPVAFDPRDAYFD